MTYFGRDPWMSRAIAMRKRSRVRGFRDFKYAAHRRPLFSEFSGELVIAPDVSPVCLDFRRLIRDVKLKPQELFALDSRQFEELVAEIWRKLGYDTELTARTKDGGRDIIAVRKFEANVRFLIECKRYNPTHKVGVELVRALYGVRMHERATKGILATTSTFTRGAKHFFDEHLWELEARDFDGVVDWVKLAAQSSD